MIHALIIGRRGTGKSALIRRVLGELNRPVVGFVTKREPEMADETLGDPIYIHKIGEAWYYAEDNLIGYCKNHKSNTSTGVFDSYVSKLIQTVPEDSMICFDELGFMEAREALFCQLVMSKLDGDIPIIAAVRDKDVPFLNEVKAHPKCKCFYLTSENWDETFFDVLRFVQDSLSVNGK